MTSDGAQTHSGRNAYRETNLLSFETHGAIPKDGKLTADDGTVLALNGISLYTHSEGKQHIEVVSVGPSAF